GGTATPSDITNSALFWVGSPALATFQMGDLDHTFPQVRGRFLPTGAGLGRRPPPQLPPVGGGSPRSVGQLRRTAGSAGVPGSRLRDREAARPGGPRRFGGSPPGDRSAEGSPRPPLHLSHPPAPTRLAPRPLGSKGPAGGVQFCLPPRPGAARRRRRSARTDPAGPRQRTPNGTAAPPGASVRP